MYKKNRVLIISEDSLCTENEDLISGYSEKTVFEEEYKEFKILGILEQFTTFTVIIEAPETEVSRRQILKVDLPLELFPGEIFVKWIVDETEFLDHILNFAKTLIDAECIPKGTIEFWNAV